MLPVKNKNVASKRQINNSVRTGEKITFSLALSKSVVCDRQDMLDVKDPGLY